MNAQSKIGGALDKLPAAKAPEATLPESSPTSAKNAGKAKTSFFTTPEIRAQFAELCHRHGTSNQKIIEKAVDTYLKSLGMAGYGDK